MGAHTTFSTELTWTDINNDDLGLGMRGYGVPPERSVNTLDHEKSGLLHSEGTIPQTGFGQPVEVVDTPSTGTAHGDVDQFGNPL